MKSLNLTRQVNNEKPVSTEQAGERVAHGIQKNSVSTKREKQ